MRLALLLALALLAAAPAVLAKFGGNVRAVEEGGEASYRFDPATLVVEPGSDVVLSGGEAEPHTLTHDAPQDQRLFDSGNVGPGANATFAAPSTVGEYPFKCLYHPGMTGTLRVRERAATTLPPNAARDPFPGVALVLPVVGAATVALGRRR